MYIQRPWGTLAWSILEVCKEAYKRAYRKIFFYFLIFLIFHKSPFSYLLAQVDASKFEALERVLKQNQQIENETIKKQKNLSPAPPSKLDDPLSKETQDKEESQKNLHKEIRENLQRGQKCIFVKKIKVGGDLKNENETAKILAPFENRCLSKNEIDLVIKTLTSFYISQGLIAHRVYIPPQKLEKEILQLVVIKGIIEDIVSKDTNTDTPLLTQSEIFMAFPFLKERELNLRTLEQGLEQINRLSTNEARLYLEAGKSLGKTKVVVGNKRSKFVEFQFSLNNFSSGDLGYLMYNIGIGFQSLLTLGELINLSFQKNFLDSSKGNYNQSTSIHFTLPFGILTASLLLNKNEGEQIIQGKYLNFSNLSFSYYQDLGLDILLFRNTVSKISIGLNQILRTSSQYIAGELLKTSSRSIQNTNISLNTSQTLGKTNLFFSLRHSRGKVSPIENEVLKNLDPTQTNYNKTNLNLHLKTPFQISNQSFQWVNAYEYQYTDSTLYSSEQWFLGGFSNVRGIKNQVLSGDKGFSARSEIHCLLPTMNMFESRDLQEAHSFFLGYDMGTVISNSTSGARGQMEGLAMGFNSQSKYAQFNITLAKSIRTPRELAHESYIWFQLSINF